MNVVTPYVNPDLDGMACAMALAALSGPAWTAGLSGEIDAETAAVLEFLRIPVPQTISAWSDIGSIWLVDTHHVRQLPDALPRDRVVRITDHHPGGDPGAFPNAVIENEPVGAAATLVAEQYFALDAAIPEAMNLLLQAAIRSNTLDFAAPATAERDRHVFARLSTAAPLPAELLAQIAKARCGVLAWTTPAIVAKDCKLFDTPTGLVLISQVEAPGALELLQRQDLVAALEAAGAAKHAQGAILNLVDTNAGASAVIASPAHWIGLLSRKLGTPVGSDGILRAGRLLQRKTDIVPHVMGASP